MEQFPTSLEMTSLPRHENEDVHEYQLSEEEERQRSNALQLAWAMSRFSGTSEERLAAALDWFTSPTGEAVSEWFRQEIMNYKDLEGNFTRKIYFLSQVSATEDGAVSGSLLQELDQLYSRRSVH